MDEYQLEFATGFGESYQNCPACGKEMVEGHSECFSCGVVVDRFKAKKMLSQKQDAVGGIEHLTTYDLKKLDKKWKQVVVNYHDQNGHQDFIGLCQQIGALPFAIHHYSKMLEIDKEDDIAQIMRRQALSRLTVATEVGTTESENPFERLDILVRWAMWLCFMFSLVCILAGIFNSELRNLVGLGVATLALFGALRLYRQS